MKRRKRKYRDRQHQRQLNQKPTTHQGCLPQKTPQTALPFVIIGELSVADIKSARHTHDMKCGFCAATFCLSLAIAGPGENQATYLTAACWPCVMKGEMPAKDLREIEVDIDCELAESALAESEATV